MPLKREDILEHLDALLVEYERLQDASPNGDLSGGASNDVLGGLKTRMLAAIHRIAPGDNPYTQATQNLTPGYQGYPGFAVIELAGVIRGLRADVADGYTSTLEELVHADLFADFLEMADELQRSGYKDAAAVIAGSTLEEHLRKLAQRHGVTIEKPDGSPKRADSLNADLAGLARTTSLSKRALPPGWTCATALPTASTGTTITDRWPVSYRACAISCCVVLREAVRIYGKQRFALRVA